MSIEIKMPALSPTMETGTLAKWLIAEGDVIASGDVVAEIETDKATMEVEAIDEGTVAAILVAAGSENVAVGTVIAIIAEDGETISEVAANQPAEAEKDMSQIQPAGSRQEQNAAPVTPDEPVPAVQLSATSPERIFATPLARRIAADKGVDLATVRGSGPHGRILRKDVEDAKAPKSAAAKVTVPRTSSATPGESVARPNSQMRKIIANRLQQSKQEAPHFYLTVDCEIDELLKARASINKLAPDGVKVSVNDMIIRAVALALMKVPAANASWNDDETRYFAHADVCMAVAVEGGLVTPVVWAAEQRGLADLATTTSDLAARAREGKLDPSEYTGGSFTISNLGMYGVREFAAVINPPQGGILAVGAGEQRPVVRDGNLAVATVMTVTLSADHRAIDGAVGAEWLQAFKEFIENPVAMLL